MTEENQCLYDKCKQDLEGIYGNIAESISSCQWYKEGVKSSKFFLNLKEFNGTQSQIRKIIANDQEITDPNKIKSEIRNFYESLFKKGLSKPSSQMNNFLDNFQLPKLYSTEINEFDNELSVKEMSLMSIQNDKTPEKDELTKEFFVIFRKDIKDVFLNSCRNAKLRKKLLNFFAKTGCHKAN